MTLEQRIHANLAALVQAKQPGRQLSPVGATIAMLHACQAARVRAGKGRVCIDGCQIRIGRKG